VSRRIPDQVTVDPDEVRAALMEVLIAIGATPRIAGLVIDHLLEAERMGVSTHGVAKLPAYVQSVLSGDVDPGAEPVVVDDARARVAIDGRRAFGQVAANRALQMVAARATTYGIGISTTRRMGHSGRIGAYVEQLAEQGLVGLAFCSLPPHQHGVVWHGTRSGRLGTNPMAYAFPTEVHAVSADFSTSASSWGRIRQAFSNGDPVPSGLIVDGQGADTTDPADYFGEPGGHLLPLGGPSGGHKGSALGLMVEMLATSLSGERPAGDRSNNLTIIAIQPGPEFLGVAADLVAHLRSADPVDPEHPTRLPGDRSRTLAARGGPLRLSRTTWDELVRTAEQAGVPLTTARLSR
jgi:LDH2 family malate/lactate/ureidoglycolate dehydrogenase